MANILDRANARSRRVPAVLFRVMLALIISAIILAIAVPALVRAGVELRGWMIWAVILASLALGVGPDMLGKRGSRR